VLELVKLIDIIVGFASPVVQNKLQRSEVVIKLLKQLNLDPDHPPADFTAVYQYTLVEYGIGKPKPVLELFRQAEIQEIFRKALDQNNPSLLLKEGEAFLSGHTLGDQIQALGIDARQEFYQFAAVFIEIAKRTRTPAEVLANQKLESLHRQIGNIQERLHRLPTLEGMRTEMARLAAQSYPALPGAIATPAAIQERQFQESQCRAFALAQQMKGWFETLGYRFESYEVWQDDYFEWIIDIPVRRGRYDRILVRGIDGEVGLKDIKALRRSVEVQRADEGWLVTARRISRAAREEVEKEENHDLGCYTFDELLDQDADFGGYLDWLESEIQRRGIEQKYVPLACTKEEIDPDTKQRMGMSRYDDRDGWIDGYIDLWLDDPAKEHISVLGEFGTGKTWFAFHYASQALKRYREAQQRGVERPRLPLVIPLRDYAKAVSVESLFSEFFFRKHEVRSLTYSAFEQLNRMGKLLLIFDGFDEMAARVDRQEMINNFWELAKAVVPGAKVILTCRTEHFPEAREGRDVLNAQLQASVSNLTGEMPQFEVLELEKFNDEQIRQVMSQQAESATVEKVMGNPQLLDLARRPVMTELILEALPDIEAGKPVDMSRVYLYAVRRKMERDIKEERTFTSLAEKLYFLCELSWEMLSTDRMSLNYREFPDRIRRLFGSVVQEEKDLDHWHYDMMGQTMLIRNADGDYMPAHRSLLEFFVAYKFAAELGAVAPDFLELAQMQSCVGVSAEPQDYTWSAYFQRTLDETGRSVAIAPLKNFVSEDLQRLRLGIGKIPLSKAVMDLLLPVLAPNVHSNQNALIKILEETQNKTEAEVEYVGGNVATLLIKLDKGSLVGKNLSRTIIIDADLTSANLCDVNFAEANLKNSSFTQCLGSVLSVAFTVDGKILVTGDTNGEIHLWRVEDSERLSTFKGHTDWVRSISLSPSGQLLASGSNDRTIRLWNIHTGKCLKILQGHSDWLRAVTFSSDSQILASSGGDQTVQLWNIDTGECLKTLQGHTASVQSVAFSPDSQLLASCGGWGDQTIRLWNVDTGKCLRVLQGHIDSVTSVAFSPDGQLLVSCGSNDDRTLRLWQVHTGECMNILEGHTASVRTATFSSDSPLLASGGFDQTIRLWDVDTGECLKILRGHSNWVRSICFSPNNQIIASGGDDQTARLWDKSSGQCFRIIQGYHHLVLSVAFSPDGQTLATGSDDGTLRLWDTNTYNCFQILKVSENWVSNLIFSPDGQVLVSGSSNRSIKLWNLKTNECFKTLEVSGHNWVMPMAFNSDSILATCSEAIIQLWNSKTWMCLKSLQGHTELIKSLAFSSDGKILASGSDDKTLKIWDCLTGQCLNTMEGHLDRVWSIALSPDNQCLASASADGTVKLWSITSGECLKTLQGHDNQVRAVAFSPNGQILASSGHDRTIKLWNVETGDCFRTLEGHSNWVVSITFKPDGQVLTSGSEDGTIRLWDVQNNTCLQVLRPKRPYEGMNITGVKGLTEAEKATLKALGAIEH
jgi:predicted NACHT family NTPase